MHELLKNKRIRLFIIAVIVIGLIPIPLKGLQFGLDFRGGTFIKIKLDRSLDSAEMTSTLGTINSRVNAEGLKDISIRALGGDFIVIEMAETSQERIDETIARLREQGNLEALFEGNVILNSTDIIDVMTQPQEGYGVYSSGDSFRWTVPFKLTTSAASRFAAAVAGRCTGQGNDCLEKVFMFIDRPQNAVVLIKPETYDAERNIPEDLEDGTVTVTIEDVVAGSGATLVVSNSLDNATLSEIRGKTVVIKSGSSYDESILNATAAKLIIKDQVSGFWVVDALNLENIVHLTPDVTSGSPILTPSITGGGKTQQEAEEELSRVAILLKSGSLPVGVSIAGTSKIPASLGSNFLLYSGLAGIVAIILVSGVVFIRYRKLNIALPIMFTCLAEVVMILGMAAWIGWQIDLPAVAGIIAAVGTGVDHQIVIADEMLRNEKDINLSNLAKTKKAFTIIFQSASTVIAAMLPLFIIGLGSLKGFALTAILGSLMGVFIARPAFAEIINYLLRKE